MTDFIINNNNNNSNNNNDIDIFADHTPVSDERNDALKGELEELRVRLQTMVASAPSTDKDMLCPDMEIWCQRWKTLTVSDFLIHIGLHIRTNFMQSPT
jgi:hypothetical protein